MANEYVITRNREGFFCIAVDGKWATPEFRQAEDARRWVMAHARLMKRCDVDITEVFDRPPLRWV